MTEPAPMSGPSLARSRRRRFLLSILILGAGLGLAAGLGHSPGWLGARASAAEAREVVIDNYNFAPGSLTVPVGTTVTWVNRDETPHTVVAGDNPRSFKSGGLDTDDKFSFTFAKPGTYDYFCTVHPYMTGKIVVR